ncbi:MAG: serine/threonine-protein kinase [Gemmatimonadales bacterium]
MTTTPTTESQPGTAIEVDVDALQAEITEAIAPQYQLLKPLGSGGMGAVFLAREPALKRLVAVKVLTPQLAADARARARFEREARTAAALSHPNIVRVFAVGETTTQRLPYIVMQYVQGPTLAHWMTQRRRVGERDARRVIGEVAAALAAAHGRELVHRDVKPSNVLLEADTGRPFVVDFGVSAALSTASDETKLTATGAIIGTPVYMSPEQAAGDPVTPKSDVYSLGVLAYELLTGEPPFQASTAMGWAAAHLRDTPTPVGSARPGLSPELARLVDRCLSKDPEVRPSAAAVARGFLPTLETEIDWPPPGLSPLRGRGRGVAIASLAMAASGIWTLFTLAFTPDILQVHPDWLDAYRALVEATGPGAGTPLGGVGTSASVTIWQMLTVLGGTAFLLSLGTLVVLGVRTLGEAARHLRLGWRPLTVLDVLADDDGQSGLLLAGTREFASLDLTERRRVLRARRFQTLASVFAGLWVGVVLLGWFALLALAGLGGGYDLAVGDRLWYVALVPTLLTVLAGVVAAFVEGRALGPLRRRRSYEAGMEEVQGWYAGLPPAAAPTPVFWSAGRRATLAVQSTLVLVGLAIGTVLVEAALSTIVAGEVTSRTGRAAAELNGTLDQLHESQPLARLRALLGPHLPAATLPNDSTARAHARTLMESEGAESLPDLPQVPLPQAGTDDMQARVEGLFRRAVEGRLGADTIQRFEQLVGHPRLAAFRYLARVDSFEFFRASLDHPLEEHDSWWNIPWPRLGGVRRAATANTGVAAMAIARGRYRDAEQRLGENAAVLLTMMRDPASIAGLLATRDIASAVLWPLAVLEEGRGNAMRARALREVAQDVELLFDAYQLPAAVALGADPDDMAAYQALVNDTTLVPGIRVSYLGAAWVGACTNPREILAGVDGARRIAAEQAARDMSDVAGASTIARLTRNDFEGQRFLGEPARGPLDRLRNLLPWNVAASLAICASVQ